MGLLALPMGGTITSDTAALKRICSTIKEETHVAVTVIQEGNHSALTAIMQRHTAPCHRVIAKDVVTRTPPVNRMIGDQCLMVIIVPFSTLNHLMSRGMGLLALPMGGIITSDTAAQK